MRSLISTAAVATVLAFIATSGMASPAGAETPDLRIFYTANVKGYVDQCGCRYNPSGGIARRATFFAQHSGSGPVLKLDGGDIVGDPEPVGRMQTTYLFRAMREMGYKTIGVGPRDYMYGIGTLKEAEKEFGFTFTNANVVGADGKPVFAPWVVEEIDGGGFLGIGGEKVTVGIVHVIGQDRPPITEPLDPEVTVLEPVQAARAAVAELKNRTDVIVLMAYVNPADLEVLQAIDGVDVVLLTRPARIPGEWVVERDNAVIGYSSIQGRGIGQIDLEIEDDGTVKSEGGSMTMLTSDVPDDPHMAALREEFEQWKTEYLAEEAN